MRKINFPSSSETNCASNEIRTSKYTPFTFLPKNLYEQFRRIANSFFLLLILLQIFPEYYIIPVWISALPLIIVIFITGAKDGIEDWARHVQDNSINNRITHRLGRKHVSMDSINSLSNDNSDTLDKQPLLAFTDVEWAPVLWKDVKVGDLLQMSTNEHVSADILILSTSESDCTCYVETMNLDGETNLKLRQGLSITQSMREPREFHSFQCSIDVEDPNPNLSSYQAIIHVFSDDERKAVVDINGILLRGTVLKNTDWVVGVVLATGEDTKQVKNSGETPSKQSELEKMMNLHIGLNLGLMVIVCITCCIGYAIWSTKYRNSTFAQGLLTNFLWLDGFVNFWAGLILYQNIVPISLYICIEFVKSFQSWFIRQDLDMYDEETDYSCQARTWNLTDNLGQIEYIFSDKTGTLTRNIMEFKKCTINGVLYGDTNRPRLETTRSEVSMKSKKSLLIYSDWIESPVTPVGSHPFDEHEEDMRIWSDHDLDELMNEEEYPETKQAQKVDLFFSLLAICHTVLIDHRSLNELELNYKAQSPDEACLVTTAAENNYVFKSRKQSNEKIEIIVEKRGKEKKVELLHVLEFDSDRKRMSVIIYDDVEKKYLLLCKGADSVIIDRLSSSIDSELLHTTVLHLESFAGEGLRTLCLAYRELSLEYYLNWKDRYHNAQTTAFADPKERLSELERLHNEVESDLQLLGATAIEDKLQYGVPECISTLMRAGIKFWVLTGDKMETSINIGHLCGLLQPTHGIPVSILQLKNVTSAFEMEELLRKFELEDKMAKLEGFKSDLALVIDGISLAVILGKEKSLIELFLSIACRCKTVICCRVSPLQKANIVEMVKSNQKCVSLAIGDGANDVSMIQAAHVGVGISGEEGVQAAMSADYSISQFRFLKKLLLVHGRWWYSANSRMVLNFYLKSLVFSLVIFWFQFYSGFTSAVIYEFTYMIFYNQVFTVAPVLILAIFDRDLEKETIYEYPESYAVDCVKHKLYTHTRYFYYTLEAFWASLMCFFVPFLAFQQDIVNIDGKTQGQYHLGTIMASSAILMVNLTTAFDTYSWNIIHFILYIGSCVVFFLYSFALSFSVNTAIYGLWKELFPTFAFWLCVLLCIVLSMGPRFVYVSARQLLFPDQSQIYHEIQNMGKKSRDGYHVVINAF